jgi:hypothetical protein
VSFRLHRFAPVALVVLASLAVQTPAAAQERSWTVRALGEVGLFLPLRTLGKNASSVLRLGSVIAELEAAPSFGVGAAIDFPEKGTTLRARFQTTPDGDVRGRLGVCGDPDDPLAGGPLCEPVNASYSTKSFSVDGAVLRGSADSRLRPVVALGLGLRRYDFDANAGQCTAPGVHTGWAPICERTVDIWRGDSGWSPMLQFGVGLRAVLGPVVATLDVQDLFGRYSGGVNRADGNTQNDLIFNLGLTLEVY